MKKGPGHCWHRATAQHQSENHKDVLCCFCGIGECLLGKDPVPEDHGHYYYKTEVVREFVSSDAEECGGRGQK